jgi:hypothetical protein
MSPPVGPRRAGEGQRLIVIQGTLLYAPGQHPGSLDHQRSKVRRS